MRGRDRKNGKGGKLNDEPNQNFLQYINEKVPEQFAKPTMNEGHLPKRMWELEHVYGYSGDRMKGGLHFGANNNEMLYAAAALGVKH